MLDLSLGIFSARGVTSLVGNYPTLRMLNLFREEYLLSGKILNQNRICIVWSNITNQKLLKLILIAKLQDFIGICKNKHCAK